MVAAFVWVDALEFIERSATSPYFPECCYDG